MTQRPPYPPPISTIDDNSLPKLRTISHVFFTYLRVVGDILPQGYSYMSGDPKVSFFFTSSTP